MPQNNSARPLALVPSRFSVTVTARLWILGTLLFLAAAMAMMALTGDSSSNPITGIVTTYAGGGAADGGPAISANVDFPYGIALDPAGNVYIGDAGNLRVRKVNLEGIISTVAGTGVNGFSGDGGPATSARISGGAQRMVSDSAGNLYIADFGNQRIRRVDTNGIINTVAGIGTSGFSGDGGPATSAQFNIPADVEIDGAGNLYISDHVNNRIRKVDAGGIITTIAGTGTSGYSGNAGPATAAQLKLPYGLQLDLAGNLFFADSGNHCIRKIDTSGVITTVAGTGAAGSSGDGGPATVATLNQPNDIVLGPSGEFYIAEGVGNRIRKVDASGNISTVAGNGSCSPTQLCFPHGVVLDQSGNLYIVDTLNWRILKLAPSGALTRVVGNGYQKFSGDGSPATNAAVSRPQRMAFDQTTNNLFFADASNHRIRKVDGNGIITTVAGSWPGGATSGSFSGDAGAAISARLNNPSAVIADGSGNLYIADRNNHRIRQIDRDGTITTYAGSDALCVAVLPCGDGGPAAAATLNFPAGVALDAEGNLYIADTNNSRIRKIETSPPHIITTVAGNGIPAFFGDGGAATAASLQRPLDIAFDAAGNLYIADSGNLRVRKVEPPAGDGSRRISTYAGNGTSGFSGDGGAAISAQFKSVESVAIDSADNLYIADRLNHRIRSVDTSGIVTTVAGTGIAGLEGDGGPASEASFRQPEGLAVDSRDNLYISDSSNFRIRKVESGVASPVPLLGMVARRVHGSAGPFDIDLPLTGSPGVECRSGGAGGDHTLVFKFANALTSVGGASASATQEGGGNQSVAATGSINPADRKEYIVNLTGVPNAQVLSVSLTNVSDSAGNSSASVSASMGVLLGDVNQTGAVDGNDVSAVQATTRQRAVETNFKADVNTSGTVDGNDVSIVQGKTRTRLP